MVSVIFMRGVNVGGHKAFSPSALAKKLASLDVINIGAAATFVVRKSIAEKALRADLAEHLSFDAELMLCTGSDILKLHADDPFAGLADEANVKRYVSVLAKRPREMPGELTRLTRRKLGNLPSLCRSPSPDLRGSLIIL